MRTDGAKETSQASLSKRSRQEPFSLKGKWLLGCTQLGERPPLRLWLSPSVSMRGSACPLVQAAPRRPDASPTLLCDLAHSEFPSSTFIPCLALTFLHIFYLSLFKSYSFLNLL